MFDYGELRLLLLAMIAKRPRHGYELIKSIEERMAGSYSPSPGVIYPTLTWLHDMGYVGVDNVESGRKCYHLTELGQDFLRANAQAVAGVLNRAAPRGLPGQAPAEIVAAMGQLKAALRGRLGQGALDPADATQIAEALQQAARQIAGPEADPDPDVDPKVAAPDAP